MFSRSQIFKIFATLYFPQEQTTTKLIYIIMILPSSFIEFVKNIKDSWILNVAWRRENLRVSPYDKGLYVSNINSYSDSIFAAYENIDIPNRNDVTVNFVFSILLLRILLFECLTGANLHVGKTGKKKQSIDQEWLMQLKVPVIYFNIGSVSVSISPMNEWSTLKADVDQTRFVKYYNRSRLDLVRC